MILANARYIPEAQVAAIDFSSAVVVDLDKARQDSAVVTVEHLFEDIVRYAENQSASDPAWGFSDSMGWRIGGSALKQLILHMLPGPLRADTRNAPISRSRTYRSPRAAARR